MSYSMILFVCAACLATGFALGHFLHPPRMLDSHGLWDEYMYTGEVENLQTWFTELRKSHLEELKEGSICGKALVVYGTNQYLFDNVGAARAYVRDNTHRGAHMLAVRVSEQGWLIGGWVG